MHQLVFTFIIILEYMLQYLNVMFASYDISIDVCDHIRHDFILIQMLAQHSVGGLTLSLVV